MGKQAAELVYKTMLNNEALISEERITLVKSITFFML